MVFHFFANVSQSCGFLFYLQVTRWTYIHALLSTDPSSLLSHSSSMDSSAPLRSPWIQNELLPLPKLDREEGNEATREENEKRRRHKEEKELFRKCREFPLCLQWSPAKVEKIKDPTRLHEAHSYFTYLKTVVDNDDVVKFSSRILQSLENRIWELKLQSARIRCGS